MFLEAWRFKTLFLETWLRIRWLHKMMQRMNAMKMKETTQLLHMVTIIKMLMSITHTSPILHWKSIVNDNLKIFFKRYMILRKTWAWAWVPKFEFMKFSKGISFEFLCVKIIAQPLLFHFLFLLLVHFHFENWCQQQFFSCCIWKTWSRCKVFGLRECSSPRWFLF